MDIYTSRKKTQIKLIIAYQVICTGSEKVGSFESASSLALPLNSSDIQELLYE